MTGLCRTWLRGRAEGTQSWDVSRLQCQEVGEHGAQAWLVALAFWRRETPSIEPGEPREVIFMQVRELLLAGHFPSSFSGGWGGYKTDPWLLQRVGVCEPSSGGVGAEDFARAVARRDKALADPC